MASLEMAVSFFHGRKPRCKVYLANNFYSYVFRNTGRFKLKFKRVLNATFFIVVGVITAIAGCAADTGVVKISDDTYLIGKQGGWESSGSVVKVQLYKEGNQFCSSMGKKFVPVSAQSDDQGPGKHATAEIQFKCQ